MMAMKVQSLVNPGEVFVVDFASAGKPLGKLYLTANHFEQLLHKSDEFPSVSHLRDALGRYVVDAYRRCHDGSEFTVETAEYQARKMHNYFSFKQLAEATDYPVHLTRVTPDVHAFEFECHDIWIWHRMAAGYDPTLQDNLQPWGYKPMKVLSEEPDTEYPTIVFERPVKIRFETMLTLFDPVAHPQGGHTEYLKIIEDETGRLLFTLGVTKYVTPRLAVNGHFTLETSLKDMTPKRCEL